jgi:hypothetical protein
MTTSLNLCAPVLINRDREHAYRRGEEDCGDRKAAGEGEREPWIVVNVQD